MTTILSFGLDIVILVALGVTIFFAVRLSNNLNKFRLQKDEFTNYIGELTKNIEAAESAVENLKQTSLATGDQLRRKVRDAQHLSDELEMMIESGESLANRLEQSAGNAGGKASVSGKKSQAKPAKTMPEVDQDNEWFLEDIPNPPNSNTKPSKSVKREDIPSFFIQDKEFSDDDLTAQSSGNENLQSQAERDLYEALQKNKARK